MRWFTSMKELSYYLTAHCCSCRWSCVKKSLLKCLGKLRHVSQVHFATVACLPVMALTHLPWLQLQSGIPRSQPSVPSLTTIAPGHFEESDYWPHSSAPSPEQQQQQHPANWRQDVRCPSPPPASSTARQGSDAQTHSEGLSVTSSQCSSSLRFSAEWPQPSEAGSKGLQYWQERAVHLEAQLNRRNVEVDVLQRELHRRGVNLRHGRLQVSTLTTGGFAESHSSPLPSPSGRSTGVLRSSAELLTAAVSSPQLYNLGEASVAWQPAAAAFEACTSPTAQWLPAPGVGPPPEEKDASASPFAPISNSKAAGSGFSSPREGRTPSSVLPLTPIPLRRLPPGQSSQLPAEPAAVELLQESNSIKQASPSIESAGAVFDMMRDSSLAGQSSLFYHFQTCPFVSLYCGIEALELMCTVTGGFTSTLDTNITLTGCSFVGRLVTWSAGQLCTILARRLLLSRQA